jgi:hypothetical protein
MWAGKESSHTLIRMNNPAIDLFRNNIVRKKKGFFLAIVLRCQIWAFEVRPSQE